MSLHLRSNVIIAAVITFGLAATLSAWADRSRGGSQVGETAILSYQSFPSDQRDKTTPRYVSALHAPDDSSLTLNFGSPAGRCAVAVEWEPGARLRQPRLCLAGWRPG
jgi:hypothetical protein